LKKVIRSLLFAAICDTLSTLIVFSAGSMTIISAQCADVESSLKTCANNQKKSRKFSMNVDESLMQKSRSSKTLKARFD